MKSCSNIGKDNNNHNNAFREQTTQPLLFVSSLSNEQQDGLVVQDTNRHDDYLQETQDVTWENPLPGVGNSRSSRFHDHHDHDHHMHWDDIVWIGLGTIGGIVLQYLWSHVILFSFAWCSSWWSQDAASSLVFVLLCVKCGTTNYLLYSLVFTTQSRERVTTTIATTNTHPSRPSSSAGHLIHSQAENVATTTTTRDCIDDCINDDKDNENKKQFTQDLVEGFMLGMFVAAVALDAYFLSNYSVLFRD